MGGRGGSVRPKVRFEVFKRDNFTCVYCGRSAPTVLLEVDHIHPKAAGGSDDFENLWTSCVECNRGKGARLLEEGTPAVLGAVDIDELAERREQARAVHEHLLAMDELVAGQVQDVIERWAQTFNAKLQGDKWICETYFPYETSIRRALRELGVARVFEAIAIAKQRCRSSERGPGHARYFVGICRNMAAELGQQ